MSDDISRAEAVLRSYADKVGEPDTRVVCEVILADGTDDFGRYDLVFKCQAKSTRETFELLKIGCISAEACKGTLEIIPHGLHCGFKSETGYRWLLDVVFNDKQINTRIESMRRAS